MEQVHGNRLRQVTRRGPQPFDVPGLFSEPVPGLPTLLLGSERDDAADTIKAGHYTGSVPSGKSHYVRFEAAIVVWSIPANNNLAEFLLGQPGNVWELSRLWAPDGHERNLLTRAISAGIRVIRWLENPDALVSYADPNAGHSGGVYHAASWIFHGQSEESRVYLATDGQRMARRAFHSGKTFLRKAEIEAQGFAEIQMPGKLRFVYPCTRKARKKIAAGVDRG